MKITIKDSAAVVRDYTTYYDRTDTPFSYNEQLDPSSGRTKTAQLVLMNLDTNFVPPKEDQEVKVYRDLAGTDLMFGGLISQVNPEVVSRTDAVWFRKYRLKLSGYDPYTLTFREVVDYEKIAIKSGQILVDLLGRYAPWIDTTNVEVTSSPLIKKIHIERTRLSDVIQSVLEKTNWTFYIDDNAHAFYNAPSVLALNWGLTEGVNPDFFPEFEFDSFQPESNVEQSINDLVLLGGEARSSKVVETFTFNGAEGFKGLAGFPYGLNQSVQLYDAFDNNQIDPTKWYEDDVGNKITAASRRLQISSLVSSSGIIVSRDLFSRDDNSEVRFAEVEIVALASGKLTIGVHNGTQSLTVTNFIHAFELDQAAGVLRTREGSTVTTFAGIPIGVGVYSVRIRIKSTGGAIYFIQGGRTATLKEYGELGSRTWTKVTETSADTTAFLGLAIRADLAIGVTVIRAKVAKQIDVTVTLLTGSKLGTGAVVAADTVLVCGVESALDFETDCFISVGQGDPRLEFFTDNLPLGNVRISYYESDLVRERLYDTANKAAVDARSSLTLDDGTRSATFDRQTFITDSQDARDLIVSYLSTYASLRYRGQFATDTFRLSKIIPVGNKPIAGQRITMTLPNTWGITASEVISSVVGTDVGGQIFKFTVQFGDGKTSFDRLLARLKNLTKTEITDVQDAVVSDFILNGQDIADGSTPRTASPNFISAVYDSSGLTISWSAVAGVSNYEVRDNLYVGQGAGGSLVYQLSGATSYTISAATLQSTHKKRRFVFYIWAIISIGTIYSRYPLIISVENPAPEPQPIRDLTNPNGTAISIRFSPEVEGDILSTGRKLQVATDRAMTSLVLNTDVSKSVENYDITVAPNTTYYIRYGLRDDYTDSYGDILYSGVREIRSGAADFSGTVQFIDNVPPSNPTTNLAISSALTPGGDAVVTFTFDYTQGSNVATNFALVFKIGGGTPSISDPSFLVPTRSSTGQTFKIQQPAGNTVSFAVIPVAVTRGGTTPIGSYQTVINHLVGGDASNTYIDDGPSTGSVIIGKFSTGNTIFYKPLAFFDGNHELRSQLNGGVYDYYLESKSNNIVLKMPTGKQIKLDVQSAVIDHIGAGNLDIGSGGHVNLYGSAIQHNGTNVATIYAGLSVANTFTSLQTMQAGLNVDKSSANRFQVDDGDSASQTAILVRQDGSLRRVKSVYVANIDGLGTAGNVLYVT